MIKSHAVSDKTRMARGDGFNNTIRAIHLSVSSIINIILLLTIILLFLLAAAPLTPAAKNGTEIVQLEDARFISPDLWVANASRTFGEHDLADIAEGTYMTIGGEPSTFHVSSLLHGGFGGDCLGCHKLGGLAPPDLQINETAFSSSVHAGLNHKAMYNATMTSLANRACWACHSNLTSEGEEPTDHPDEYWNPRPCVACHRTGSFEAPAIYEHFYKGGSTGSTAGIAIRVECVECHLNGTAGHEQIPQMSAEAVTSHYASRDHLPATDNCSICHQDKEGGAEFGSASQVFAHDKAGSCDDCHGQVETFHDRELVIPPERTCEACHTSAESVEKYGTPGQIRTHYPGAPDGSVDTTMIDETLICAKCHNVSGTNEDLHSRSLTRHLDESEETAYRGYCFDCHAEGGTFPYQSQTLISKLSHGKAADCMAVNCIEPCHNITGVSTFHAPTDVVSGYFGLAPGGAGAECMDCHPRHMRLGDFGEDEVECLECHPGYEVAHYSDAIVAEVNKTYTCALCHNEKADQYHNLTYVYGDGETAVDESCYVCHARDTNFTEVQTLAYGTGEVRGGVMITGAVQDVDVEEAFTCTECHNVTDTPFHYSPYPLGSAQDPGWASWTPGERVKDCKDCHTNYGDVPPFNATDMSSTGHGHEEDCYVCHGGRDPVTFHTLEVFDVTPHVAEISVAPDTVHAGDSVVLSTKVVTGWKMEVRYIEYFVDIIGENGCGTPLTFTRTTYYGQATEAAATIDTTGWSEGRHTIFVKSLDSRGVWGEPGLVMLTVTKPEGVIAAIVHQREIIFMGTIALIALIIVLLYIIRWRGLK
ncbi:MAG: hypothetical protein EF813_05760 [Methanosarcinales archaeon]|nr:MAG: hypothetical protein EF813_05760 [Methanosarcinales archaeon]